MMNQPVSEAAAMSYHDYQAMLWYWNEAHNTDSEGDYPDPDRTMALLDKINADPRLTGPAPVKELVN